MKRTLFLAVVILFTLAFLSTNLNAQTSEKKNAKGSKTCFVDKNGDGICDNAGTANHGDNKSCTSCGKKDGSGNTMKHHNGNECSKKANNGICKSSGVCDGSGPKGIMPHKGGK